MKDILRVLLIYVLLGLAILAGAIPAAAQEPEREELAISALEALMAADAERALPLVEKVLESDHSDRVKKRALFVASQIGLPRAQELLLDFARTESALQGEAIRMIGIGGNPQSLGALDDIYAGAGPDIRERILQAYLIADESQRIVRIAEQATSDDEFETAVRMLAVMGATEELRELGRQGGGPGMHKRGLFHAYAVAGDLDSLRPVALGETGATPEVRLEAIQGIGIIGSDAARETLMRLYRETDDARLREKAMRALMVAGHDTGLLELYREAVDSRDKRDLLRILVMMNSDAAIDAIEAALDGENQ